MKLLSSNQYIVISALVTPFQENLEIDYESLKRLTEHQIQHSIDGIVILGTTGESPTITQNERLQLIESVIKYTNKRCDVLVGTGSNSTQKTIEWTNEAKSLGADASLIVTPYYNNPSNEEIYNHYKMIESKTQFPFFLYHVPKRTGSCLDQSTINKILNLNYCIGFKDATSNTEWIQSYPKGKILLDGDDYNAAHYCKNGGNGVISVISNAYPKLMGKHLHTKSKKLELLIKALSCHVNPVPIKALLEQLNVIATDKTRPPLHSLNPNLKRLLKEHHILEEIL